MNSSAPSDSAIPSVLLRRVPALDALRSYSGMDARADLLAGLSVAAVAVPQAMAYALIVGVPVEYGLYTAIVMTIVGALFDSSRQLINGPTNAISIAVLSAVGAFEAPDARVQAAVTMALLIGLIQVGISLMRLGDLTRYISHSVIVGFTAGASVLLLLDQAKNLMGLKAMGGPHDHFLVRFYLSMTQGGAVHGPTLAIGLGAIAGVLGLRWLKARLGWTLLPEMLIVVALAAAVTAQLGLQDAGVRVVGTIPARLPGFHPPALDAAQVRDLASSALAVALLGLLEAVSMAKVIAGVTRQKLDMNQQCLSEGLANVAGSFFQCIPGSGSLTRSAINMQAGARTQWAGVVSALAVAATMLVFAPWAQYIPRSALAGVLMLTAARMVNLRELRYHLRASHFDAIIVVTTALAAFAISIEFCVLIGVVMSFLLAVPRAGNMLLTEFVVAADGGIHERIAEDAVCGHILIFGLEGEMFFGAATALEAHFDAIEARVAAAGTQVVVLRVKRARNPDAVALALLAGFIDRMAARDVRVVLCGVRADMYESFQRSGIARRLRPEQLFREQPVRQTSTLLAVRYAYGTLTSRCEACPHGDFGGSDLYYAH